MCGLYVKVLSCVPHGIWQQSPACRPEPPPFLAVHRSDHSHLGLSLRVPGNQVPQSENAGTGLALLGVISVLQRRVVPVNRVSRLGEGYRITMMGLCPHCICGARHIRQVASNQGAAYKGKGVMYGLALVHDRCIDA